MKEQITIEELLALEPGSYLLYDMRDRYSFDYGAIPGAEHKEQAAILEAADSLPIPVRLVQKMQYLQCIM